MEFQRKLDKLHRYTNILKYHIYRNGRHPDSVTVCPADYKSGHMPPPEDEFVPYTVGSAWGDGKDRHAWFHFTFTVPEEMKSMPIDMLVKTERSGWDVKNHQFICYINGVLRQGLDINHRYVRLDKSEGTYDVYLYAYTGPHLEKGQLFVELHNVCEDAEQLYYDVRAIADTLNFLDTHSREYAEVIDRLDRAYDLIDMTEPGSEEYYASLKAAREYVRKELYDKLQRENDTSVTAIGHTHIDCAWQWTFRQTREKVQRSFSTVLSLMRRFPEYKFMSSQALLYKYLKEEAPALYEELKERVKEGRWETEGAMWVEADCNMTSGESLVRQFLYGKRFFRQEFGVDHRILWLPDVFGYSAALPQIIKKSGCDWFVTSKISWNETNTMPNDTFYWYGIDGTPVNAYFLTAQDKKRDKEPERYTTYVGMTTPSMIAGTYERYQNKELSNEALLTFGWGDGGGGPTAEHLEMLRRSEKGLPGVPRAKCEFAGDFLRRLEKRLDEAKSVPTWHGELYLEFHRGTYTSMSMNKRENRKAELLYQNTELISEMAKHLTGLPFPKNRLHLGWENLLQNHFHDVISGTSIHEVHRQCEKDYIEDKRIASEIRDTAVNAILCGIDKNEGYVVFNPHSFTGDGYVRFNGKAARVCGIPPKGYAVCNDFVTDCKVEINEKRVETDRLTVLFNDAYEIVSIYDKAAERELIKQGCVANELRAYPDLPVVYDDYEWERHSLDQYKTVTAIEKVSVVDDGARRGIRIVRPYRRSKITQTLWFYDGTTEIDIDTHIDWHERHIMLKTAFPVDIHAENATYEIQFGTVTRPTHTNTSWDAAKFEVCAHKYADLSDAGYGVSLMNDAKYGYDIHEGVMQLSLLRSPTEYNTESDQGEQSFTYALYLHEGNFTASDTPCRAYYLNYPMTVERACGEKTVLPTAFSLVSVDKENVIVDTVKEAEDGTDTVIRLFETKGARTKVHLTFGIPVSRIAMTDLMEENEKPLDTGAGTLTLTVKPYEIVTLKISR